MPKVIFIAFGPIDILEGIKAEVAKILNIEVEIYSGNVRVDARQRGTQLDAEDFIPIIGKTVKKADADYGLGITTKDLYVPGLNFVFGLASLLQKSCVISLARLIDKDKNLYIERAVKEAVHELGHLFGLQHCADTRCVMHFSNSLEDTNHKGKRFCKECARKYI